MFNLVKGTCPSLAVDQQPQHFAACFTPTFKKSDFDASANEKFPN
jgi:hypothetical protein